MGVYFRILHLRALPFTVWVPCYRSHTHLRRGFIRSFDYILYFALFYSPPPHIVGSQLFLMIWYPRFQISSQWIYFLLFFFVSKTLLSSFLFDNTDVWYTFVLEQLALKGGGISVKIYHSYKINEENRTIIIIIIINFVLLGNDSFKEKKFTHTSKKWSTTIMK